MAQEPFAVIKLLNYSALEVMPQADMDSPPQLCVFVQIEHVGLSEK